MPSLELVATCAFGLEAVVKRELKDLGLEGRVVQQGRIGFAGEPADVARTNLWLRSAERVLICLGRIPAGDFDALFDGARDLPWSDWIRPDGAFPVRARSHKSQLTSVPALQRTVKKAVVESLLAAHQTETLPETGPTYAIEAVLLDNEATLLLDTTGEGLHKRGYRPQVGDAPLRETLAAALVQLSFWRRDRPLADPFCGTGTIAIEAALIARNLPPGGNRTFAAEAWPRVDPALWRTAREEARSVALPPLEQRIIATDVDEGALRIARRCAEAAGVAEDIHFQQRAFAELSSKQQYGCVICNPPYGHRLGEQREVEALYHNFPLVLRRLPTWSHFILTAHPRFEAIVGQSADRRRKMYNGRIVCQYYQYHGPPPGSVKERPTAAPEEQPVVNETADLDEPAADADATDSGAHLPAESSDTTVAGLPVEPRSATAGLPSVEEAASQKKISPPAPVFGGVTPKARQQAELFRNRLAKRARHLRRWPARGVTCYRLYERDIPEVPLVVDRYEDRLHLAEFARPHDRTPAEHADWLDLMQKTAGEVLDVPRTSIFMKFRDRQRGASQYERRGSAGHTFVVHEGGLKFQVNLSDYVDTGLFLDHRITRDMVRCAAAGSRMLNLFGYTGSFSVYAGAGGAAATTTVDLSNTYLAWAEENLRLNGLLDAPDARKKHRLVQSDALGFLRKLEPDVQYDLAVVDPPTFSNSKNLEEDWDVQRDYLPLLTELTGHLAPKAVVYFSTNFRRFKLAEAELAALGLKAHEISRQTVPEDFRNRRIHRCWRMTRV